MDNSHRMKHQADGHISSTASQSTSAKRKRLQQPLPYEQILAEFVDRAKRKFEDNDDKRCLGHAKHNIVKTNFLGPLHQWALLLFLIKVPTGRPDPASTCC